ncbi:MAG: hypothetical protein IT440_08985 [Phycisphaeraceae bacterium]|nr:hypothetical protein [Phycisphaeraceae bacterium]
MAKKWTFQPAQCVPFRDMKAIERCRKIKRKDIEKHPNKDFKIKVVSEEDMTFMWLHDMYARIDQARKEGRRCVMLMPNPWPGYRHLARLINETRLDCKHVWLFAMDEYANEDGITPPDSWPKGFYYSLLKFLWKEIDPDLRMPRKQVFAPTNDVIDHYYDLMQEVGGLDISYTGPGWTGHMAFVEPDAPEFDAPLKEWKNFGARICTLSPFTLAQNSLHGCFGFSGDLSAVPPKAATVGPKEVISAKNRWEMAGITVRGTTTSWQRLIARLCYHGPVTPRIPTSILQLYRTDCFISEAIAADIVDSWDVGY